jgi:segregation and condensation protein A
MRPADLQLDLDTYAGPFDLLCTLLLKRELPIGDVALAEIVVGYVQRLAVQERVDPNAASEFLLLVAGLMEVKSREILADDVTIQVEDPASAEAQAEMLERLVRYTTFRRAASWLAEQAPGHRWWRVASRPVRRHRHAYDGPVMDPALLARALGVLAAQPGVDVRHLVGGHASVQEMTGRLLSVLRSRRRFELDEVFEGLSRLDQSVAFVAALELCKNGQVELAQDEPFGPITVTQRTVAQGAPDSRSGAATDARTTDVKEVQTA